jgi:hypothetical protein
MGMLLSAVVDLLDKEIMAAMVDFIAIQGAVVVVEQGKQDKLED